MGRGGSANAWGWDGGAKEVKGRCLRCAERIVAAVVAVIAGARGKRRGRSGGGGRNRGRRWSKGRSSGGGVPIAINRGWHLTHLAKLELELKLQLDVLLKQRVVKGGLAGTEEEEVAVDGVGSRGR